MATQLMLTISGGAPYGLRLATDSTQRIVVDKVRKNGKADDVGLREGDVVLSINGRSCSGTDSVKASQWIDTSGQKLTIQVIRGATEPLPTSAEECVIVPIARPENLDSPDHGAVSTKCFSGGNLRPITKSALSAQGSTPTDFTITAPVGVDVQQNTDRSFTVTIGLPFQLDIGQSSIGQSSVKTTHTQPDERFSSKHSLTFQKKDVAQLQQEQADDCERSTPLVLRAKQVERILSEGSGSEPSTPSSTEGGPPRSGKKLFVDSAFYDDPEHRYPTVEEQVQLARQVAQSVLSPANLKSKGHRMFIKRKERAIRWTTGLTDEEKTELTIQMGEAKAEEEAERDRQSVTQGRLSPQMAPLGLLTSIMFAPKLPTEKNVDKLNAMSNEELERMVLLERKTTHTNVSPQVCFSLVDDLRNIKGKGGKLFAKRQAKSEMWDKSAEDKQPTDGGNGSTAEPSTEPNLRIGEPKTEDKTKTATVSREPAFASGAVAPVNRLIDLVERQKAALTPWDAAAQYGSVEKAFEHLVSIHEIQKPALRQQGLVGGLRREQKRKERGEMEMVDAVRPKSTIGCVERTAVEVKSADENKYKTKIEALGGNPNAAGLASAMTASWATATSSAGGYRSLKQRIPTSKSGEAEIPQSTVRDSGNQVAGSTEDRSCSPKAPLHA